MDFSSLTNWLQEKMAGMQSFRGQDGVLYGPAQARQSRLDVIYHPTVGEGTAGEYSPGPSMSNLGAMSKGIHVYPNSRLVKNDGSTSPTLEHEEVHALQDSVGQLGKGASIPGYAEAIKGLRGYYNLPVETPANAIAYDPKYTPDLSRSAADTYSANVIAVSPSSIQGGLQKLADSARARIDANDATLASKAKQ